MQLSRASVFVAPVLILLLFAPALVGFDRLGFRDVGHFYTPLYDYVAARTSQRWLPLWNPLDATGMPLLGETTTAVLYPVRYLLFSLPLAAETVISWYVVLHLILASVGARAAARWSGVGPLASSIAAVVYPLSGSVLFLYTNPAFLVGAAWLPWVLGPLLARQGIDQRVRAVVAAVSMSMMILGGDPQSALHAMMVAVAITVGRMVLRRQKAGLHIFTLVGVPLLAATLAAPQMAASLSWTRQSDRLIEPGDRSWLDPPIVGGKKYESFQFSLAPWHALELATPDAFGRLFPTNHRISQLIPGDGRTWTPSIYMGSVVLLTLLCRVGGWRSIDCWTVTALMGIWLAMGQFGVVWMVQAGTGWLSEVDSAVGGPYWCLYQWIPGYDAFRYPAKWLSVFALAASLVTAKWVDNGICAKRIPKLVVWLAAILSVVWLIVWLLRWNPSLVLDRAAPRDEYWGPLDVDAAFGEIGRSLVHSVLTLLAIAAAIRLGTYRQWSQQSVKAFLLAIVAVDVAAAGCGWIARVPRRAERQILAQLEDSDRESKSIPGAATRWLRTQQGRGWPRVWRQTRNPRRLLEVQASERLAWFGRWHLADRAAVWNNMVSIRSQAMDQFWSATKLVTAEMSSDDRDRFWASLCRWFSIHGVTHTTERAVVVIVEGQSAQIVQRVDRVGSSPVALRAHSRWTLDPSRRPSIDGIAQRLRAIAQASGDVPPVVHAHEGAPISPWSDSADVTIDVINQGPEHLEVRVRSSAPVLWTRPVYQDGHWHASYAPAGEVDVSPIPQQVPVHRVDHLIQGVLLPAGHWRLRFDYAPWWLGWSMALASVAWIGVVAVGLLSCHSRARFFMRRQQQRPHSLNT